MIVESYMLEIKCDQPQGVNKTGNDHFKNKTLAASLTLKRWRSLHRWSASSVQRQMIYMKTFHVSFVNH